MGLHGNVSIQVIQSAVGFLATSPPAFIHAFYFFIASPGALVLLGAGNGHKRINLSKSR
jgi:hypothetical protein